MGGGSEGQSKRRGANEVSWGHPRSAPLGLQAPPPARQPGDGHKSPAMTPVLAKTRLFRTRKNWPRCRPPSASATGWSAPTAATTPTTTSPSTSARGELDELKAEVQAKLQEVLQALVIDTDSDHNNETAKRVAKMFIDEVFRGRFHRRRR